MLKHQNLPKHSGLLVIAVIFLFSACAPKVKTPLPLSTGDNSMVSLDWNGTYTGTLPCADCEGIETYITLNLDKTYLLKTKYIGRSDTYIEHRGNFTWNEAGSTIILSDVRENPKQFLVGEGKLFQLDMSGKRITGDLADKYILTKTTAMAGEPLFDNQWKLIELMGKAIPSAAEPMNNITLKFSRADNRISGFSGCNTYTGGFTSTAPLRISFAQMVSTMKACPTGMELESEYLKMLAGVDNYTINGNVLSLNKARMAPLARFESVKAK
jgi:heat shock protein HslJ